MLYQFKVGNYRSFSAVKTLSLVPASITDHPENILTDGKNRWLSAAVVYGANSSGKSNLLRAMGVMKQMVTGTFDKSSVSALPYDPFLLEVSQQTAPTHFEITFQANGIRYRYGFEYTSEHITAEWLFEAKKKTDRPLFIRSEEGIQVMSWFQEGKNLEEKTRDNALFINVVDQFNGPTAGVLMKWFKEFNVISGLSHENYRKITFDMLEHPATKQDLVRFYKNMDLGFDQIEVYKQEVNPDEMTKSILKSTNGLVTFIPSGPYLINISSTHPVYDEHKQAVGQVEFDTRGQESAGTNKLIDLSGPVFATLHNGGILVVDELDSKLHPLLTLSIIRLFQNPEVNTKNAQLIFASHDTNILSFSNLRRDQIYFVEKDQYGASDLYSLAEYKSNGKVRKDRSFEKDYLDGRYGAVPYLSSINPLFS